MATVEARVAAVATAEEGVEEEVKEAEAETAAGERVALQKHTMAHSASVTGAYTVAMRVFKVVVCTHQQHPENGYQMMDKSKTPRHKVR